MKNILFIAMLVLTACKKETTLSGAELLSTRDWKAISVTRQLTPTSGISETLATAPECIKDDIYVFRHDNLFLRIEGISRCNPADPDVVSSANWSLSLDEKTLTIGAGTNSIMKLDTDSLVYQVNGLGTETRIIRYASIK